jgi:hypothetical protein
MSVQRCYSLSWRKWGRGGAPQGGASPLSRGGRHPAEPGRHPPAGGSRVRSAPAPRPGQRRGGSRRLGPCPGCDRMAHPWRPALAGGDGASRRGVLPEHPAPCQRRVCTAHGGLERAPGQRGIAGRSRWARGTAALRGPSDPHGARAGGAGRSGSGPLGWAGAHGAAPAVAHGHGAADRGAVAGVGGPFPLAPHPPRDWPGESRTIGATCAARRRSARDVAGRPRRGSHASRGRTRPSLRGGMAPKKPGTGSEQGHRWGERVLSFRQICRLRGRPPCPMLLEAVVCLGTGEEPDLRWLAPRESLPVCSTPWPHTSGDRLHLQFSHYARRCVVTLGPNHSVALEINLSRKL